MHGRKMLLTVLSVIIALSLSGCWDYKEINESMIIAGVGIDKSDKNNKILLTIESVDIEGSQKDEATGAQDFSLSGKNMFVIVRGMISITGKKLYWSHAKSIIISESLAREGVVRVIDWYARDTETRADINMYISTEPTAKEILTSKGSEKKIISFELDQLMKAEESLNTAPNIQIWDFIDRVESEGRDSVAPTVFFQKGKKKSTLRVSGLAVFKKDKMVGSLSGQETKYFLMATDELKGGVFEVDKDETASVTLEILDNKTKIKPLWINEKPQILITTETSTAIDEISYQDDLKKNSTITEIENRAARNIESEILEVIHRVQKEYGSDIFGFGTKFNEEKPKIWKKIKKNWDSSFPDVEVTVQSKVTIKNTAKTSRTIEMSD